MDRDFFRELVLLGKSREIEPLIERALALIVEATGAEQAYIELGAEERPYFCAHGCDGQDRLAIRASISRGVVNEALSTGRTVIAASAVHDSRFALRESVKRHQIDAVLCAAVGGLPALGIVYLRGRRNAGPFGAADVERVDMLAAQLAPLARGLIEARRRAELLDATESVRRRLRCDALVGQSRALAEVLEQVALAAPVEIDVLISGESGTGKTALARVIADNSKRARGPFVELNCAALPDSLFESELFGAAKGSHSTADREMKGKLAAAHGGTLFLDEIAELSLAGQAKLLQVLQARTYYPLGASAPVRADVRVVAATNRDLTAAIAAGAFRSDLYYRLNVMPVHMPSLAERRDDVPLLVLRCVDSAVARHGLGPMLVSRTALWACRDADWPGNVRELLNTVEAAVIRAHGARSQTIEVVHLFPSRQRSAERDAPTLQEATRLFQRDLLDRTLEELGWNVASAARRLGIARSYLYTLIELHALRRTPSQRRAS